MREVLFDGKSDVNIDAKLNTDALILRPTRAYTSKKIQPLLIIGGEGCMDLGGVRESFDLSPPLSRPAFNVEVGEVDGRRKSWRSSVCGVVELVVAVAGKRKNTLGRWMIDKSFEVE